MNRNLKNTVRLGVMLFLPAAVAIGQTESLPDAPGREVVQRVCGACHAATVVVGRGMTQEGWDGVVASMISRGAKGTPSDFKQITDYLARNFPPAQSASKDGSHPPRAGRSHAGPGDQAIVDPDAAGRGSKLYTADCLSCHGPMARGGTGGPDLVRSSVVLHDRYGDTLTPYLRDQHPKTEAAPIAALSEANIQDLSHFLRQQVGNTLRSGPFTKVLNVLTGDAQAGKVYFNGPGECTKCHSAEGDLAGIASRYDPPALQQRVLFPRTMALGRGVSPNVKRVTVEVASEDGQSVSGELVYADEFNVSLRDSSDNYRSWKRTPGLKVDIHDPYKTHDDLLDRITDPDIHNLVAYLETLK